MAAPAAAALAGRDAEPHPEFGARRRTSIERWARQPVVDATRLSDAAVALSRSMVPLNIVWSGVYVLLLDGAVTYRLLASPSSHLPPQVMPDSASRNCAPSLGVSLFPSGRNLQIEGRAETVKVRCGAVGGGGR